MKENDQHDQTAIGGTRPRHGGAVRCMHSGGAASQVARLAQGDRGAGGGPAAPRRRRGKCTVGVSWNNYQEERWAKWDEPAIKAALAAGGATYISNDAKSSAETQATNVENLISQGAKVADHPGPGRHRHQAVGRQRDPAGHAGHRLRPPDRGSARRCTSPSTTSRSGACRRAPSSRPQPKGNYVIIKGNKADANADFLRGGYEEVIGDAVDSRRHQDRRRDLHRQLGSVQGADRDGAVPDREQQQGRRGAVRERRHGRWRRRRAGGAGSGRQGAGVRSGRRRAGAQPGRARHPDGRRLEGLAPARQGGRRGRGPAVQRARTSTQGRGTEPFTTPGGNSVSVDPAARRSPITKDNLNVVLDAGWITKADLCKGVTAGSVAAAG